MNTKASGARAKGHKMLEPHGRAVVCPARVARLNAEVAESRADVGARGELAKLEPVSAAPGLDERLFPLVFDSLACIQAQLASSIAGVPYAIAREATRFSEAEKAKLVEALQKVAIKHAAAFADHKEDVELGVAFIAIQATQLDQVLRSAAGDEPLTWKQCLVGLLFTLAPLLIPLAIYLLNLLVMKLRG